MAIIIDGKALAQRVKDEIKIEVEVLKEKRGVTPGLAVILAGDHPSSQVYVRAKGKACNEVGIASFQHNLHKETRQEELLWLITQFNEDPNIHGILVQLPLPPHLNEEAVLEAIRPDKDVDGFHPINMGRLILGKPLFQPCTPLAIMRLLHYIGIDVTGKEAVVVGRSKIVGRPVALMLLQRNATVTICHSKTVDLPSVTRRADILVVAVGKPRMVKGDWVKEGSVVIDVGVNRLDDETLVGDVDFDEVSKRASFITPVPGGVGPMTIAMLLHNTVEAAKLLTKK